MTQYDIVGAIKIKDGLYLGDEYAAQDLEFIITNKVTQIINCSAKQIPNHWENFDVTYLSYDWQDSDNQIIFDDKDQVVNITYNLIEKTLEKAESILVHSEKGQNRSVCIITAYLMKKYRWGLYKTLEFLHSRRQDLEVKAYFFNQLLTLENKLKKQGVGPRSYNWNELSDRNDQEEILLKNTFLNSKLKQIEEEDMKKDFEKDIGFCQKNEVIQDFDLDSFNIENEQLQQNVNKNKQEGVSQKKIEWVDDKSKGEQQLCVLEIPIFEQCNFNVYNSKQIESFKSIIKGSNKIFQVKFQSLNNINLERNDQALQNQTQSDQFINFTRKKTNFRTKKMEDFNQEKKIIMQKTEQQSQQQQKQEFNIPQTKQLINLKEVNKIQSIFFHFKL
ncbi:dual specificity catalytic domain protein [Ichthyophthirius multifiliis]|uniref:Dual specificity catalytic domain protein n=1 Tax=Ichthyophthirius multifiliis TaxID=5932 RepID=G0QPB2_ICHMU|nr:dual specificity catalytic domain protein [Ichthyophthirius multifiliis]EGR32949.1 dual specificity catalytic domain protein [Ichthyophthirius multifiliis]|eukprot:XP_004036935.1 dual specificity catalytic domain protein [Ichthyophthirius multifiliis]